MNRELPEPEGYLCDWGDDSYGLPRIIVYYGEPGSASIDDWNETPKVHKNTPIFTRDQVLAIQKQAYEDGLRDAEDRSNGLEKTMQWHMKEGSGVSTHSEFPDVVVMNKSLYALLMDSHEELTASQKRDE